MSSYCQNTSKQKYTTLLPCLLWSPSQLLFGLFSQCPLFPVNMPPAKFARGKAFLIPALYSSLDRDNKGSLFSGLHFQVFFLFRVVLFVTSV